MKVKIKYFASVREATGKSEEIWETRADRLGDIFDEVAREYGLQKDHLKVALNEEYASFEQKFREMDTIALIPPVAGG